MNAIERVMQKTNFERIQDIMKAYNHTYAPNNDIPTIERLQSLAFLCLNAVLTNGKEFGTASTGGFTAYKAYNEIHLLYSPPECNSFTGLDY